MIDYMYRNTFTRRSHNSHTHISPHNMLIVWGCVKIQNLKYMFKMMYIQPI